MRNLLEQAIGTDDGDRAAKMIRVASALSSIRLRTTYFRKRDQPIASNVPGFSVNGCEPNGEWLRAEARFLASPSIVPE